MKIIQKLINKSKYYMYSISRKKDIYSIVNKRLMRLEQFGNEYGGYKLALDLMLKNEIINVFSFGIGEDLSFSESLLERYENAVVYAFDPTPRTKLYIEKHRLNSESRFHYYPVGISKEDGTEIFYFPKVKEYVSCSTHQQDWVGQEYCEVEMNSFSTIIKNTSITKLNILKMDIEGSEFDVMDKIFESGIEITQICIEVHDYLFSDGTGKEKLNWILNLFKNNNYSLIYLSKSLNEMTFVKEKQYNF